MLRRPPRSTRADPILPCTTLFRSARAQQALVFGGKPRDAHGHVGHVERAGHSIENADGDEEDRRSDQIDDDVLDARLQPLLSLTVQDQPIGGDQQHLEKDEEVEQVARQKCAVQPQQLKLEERSDEHKSELQSLMRISYAVFCLHKKKNYNETNRKK